ncbi:unnamed protein product [Brugia timori]|uniref:Peptidase S8/S53 domain-containing protein n=1 Tax=Brugia timori TaxID=42155 RepID=A0A3P7U5W7_9BILA|nr:unnamed protein product [Brugia timori]
MKASQLMNGTSMSSPNVTGTVACLLSALKAQSISWSPYLIRLALENTARLPKDQNRFTVGSGLLQVDDAYNFIHDHQSLISPLLTHFKIKINDVNARGIYLRERYQTCYMDTYVIAVQPEFKPESGTSLLFIYSLLSEMRRKYYFHQVFYI